MSPGATYAAITFLAGILCLLGWLYATADNPRSTTLLKRSLWLIVLPMLLTPAPFFTFPLGMWALVAFEEAVKSFASTREQEPRDKFWRVALFGVWELTIDKPFWGLVVAQSAQSWDRVSLTGLVIATTIPVLMHAVTAAIYAFWFDCRLWAAFCASWLVHTAYNESVDYFGISPTVQITQAVCLGLLLAALIPKRQPAAITNLP
jgi:hypothetical protein